VNEIKVQNLKNKGDKGNKGKNLKNKDSKLKGMEKENFKSDGVTENPGIKPCNTNVVLKGRHSLLQRRMHGG